MPIFCTVTSKAEFRPHQQNFPSPPTILTWLLSHLKQISRFSFMGNLMLALCTVTAVYSVHFLLGPIVVCFSSVFPLIGEKKRASLDRQQSVYIALNSYCHGVLPCLYHLISIYVGRSRRFGGKRWYYLVKMKNLFFKKLIHLVCLLNLVSSPGALHYRCRATHSFGLFSSWRYWLLEGKCIAMRFMSDFKCRLYIISVLVWNTLKGFDVA